VWTLLLFPVVVAAEPSLSVALPEAVRMYYDGGRSSASVAFEVLYAQRPFDDDVAWWMARARVDRDLPQEALGYLAGRDGRKLPPWQFRVLEATALVLLGRDAEALSVLEASWPQVAGTAERPGVAALYGMLLAQAGRDVEAATALRLAGPEALLVLDPVLVGHLEIVAVMDVRAGADGLLDVTRSDGAWRVDLATGLARRPGVPVVSEPRVWGEKDSPRGRPDRCSDGPDHWVWSSPQEALGSHLPGVYRGRGGQVQRIALTPPGAVDVSPACLGDHVWFIRRLGDHAEILHVHGRALVAVETPGLGLATVDARSGSLGKPELVLGVVVEGVPGVYWIPTGTTEPQPLLVADRAMHAPRWVD
jgi:hypothetical protein